MGALKLRYDIDRPERLREHLHLAGGAGYFFFPSASAPDGARAILQVTFGTIDQNLVLHGSVWARPAGGGVWLELPRARECLGRLSQELPRTSRRMATEQLVLAEPRELPGFLCRLIDVGDGGARLCAGAAEVGSGGHQLRIALPEAGPSGGRLEAYGRVAWSGDGEVGVAWDRRDLASRATGLRLLQTAEDEWEQAPNGAHSPGCRCINKPPVLLLG
jgi:hypothetical protein